jgi:hypothetical protein
VCGIDDNGSAPKDDVNLNNVDDWYEFHQADVEIADRSGIVGALINLSRKTFELTDYYTAQ